MPQRPALTRRHLLAAALGGACGSAAAARRCAGWPLWSAFAGRFIQADGRVIDDQHQTRYTTSEGQAYVLFFALVANERERFDTLLRWTDRHLAQGALGERLPGWRWGRHDDGEWKLLDANAAADADLWLAHTLFEAARLWRAPRHRELAQALLALIRDQEVVELPGFGPTLLPGPLGFQLDGGAVRLNPSYLALHQLRALAREDASGPWDTIAAGMPRLLAAVAPRGLVPDWVRHSERLGWHAADDSPPLGSWDAIRAYLWAGLVHPGDPLRPALLHATRGMAALLQAGTELPRQVRTDTGQALGSAPAGFSAALLPWLRATGRTRLLAAQQARLRALSADGEAWPAGCPGGLIGQPPTYYDQALALFGTGAVEERFAFDVQGRLVPAWGR
ncbi:cellulose synthase complex periplasmic endoglucanase BcsZ [Azohydromonas aeria]|uniref:cellulose synthase complex periplasmic endoglucanase BcsZ n=1 Tax=Azohydromonas aeria TaxID=2590212 RepID=UPI0012FB0173|nr:cellulose synthase complex periplasmic endoglucanase BcsZ [Azohydromonas aeria]